MNETVPLIKEGTMKEKHYGLAETREQLLIFILAALERSNVNKAVVEEPFYHRWHVYYVEITEEP